MLLEPGLAINRQIPPCRLPLTSSAPASPAPRCICLWRSDPRTMGSNPHRSLDLLDSEPAVIAGHQPVELRRPSAPHLLHKCSLAQLTLPPSLPDRRQIGRAHV